MFSDPDPLELEQEAREDLEMLEPFHVTERQIYQTLFTYNQHFASLKGIQDYAVLHETALKLAKRIATRRGHKLRPLVSRLVETLPAHLLF